MKTFIVSRRFLLPLLVVWIVLSGYLTWSMWLDYKKDFQGKGLPARVKTEWLWSLAASSFLVLSFLAALLVATAWYSHYRSKREAGYRPFSPISVLSAAGIALLAFIYTSYCVPKLTERKRQLLVAIVYARSAAEFDAEVKVPLGLKDAKVMTLPELFDTRDSLTARKRLVTNDRFGFESTTRNEKEINYLIANKTGLPAVVLLFYVLGVFSGISFRRTHVVFPALMAFFILFAGWYYGQEFFRITYNHGKISAFAGANGTVLILAIIALCWFFILRRYGMFKPGKEYTR